MMNFHAELPRWSGENRPPARGERAFSRMELVVVLAALALVVALRLAAAPDPKIRTARVTCLNNLRQLTIAWLNYAADADGRMPGNLDGEDAQNIANSNKTWCLGWLDFQGGAPAGANTNLDFLRMAQLGRYIGPDLRVFKCPADLSLSNGTNGARRVRSVSMNCYMGQRSAPFTAGFQQFLKMSELVRLPPSQAFVFMDEREDSIDDAWFAFDMTGYAPANPRAFVLVDFPGDYHERGANLSFADGHLETWKWRDPRTTPPHVPGQNLSLGIGVPFSPDVQRLQAATSRKVD